MDTELDDDVRFCGSSKLPEVLRFLESVAADGGHPVFNHEFNASSVPAATSSVSLQPCLLPTVGLGYLAMTPAVMGILDLLSDMFA